MCSIKNETCEVGNILCQYMTPAASRNALCSAQPALFELGCESRKKDPATREGNSHTQKQNDEKGGNQDLVLEANVLK